MQTKKHSDMTSRSIAECGNPFQPINRSEDGRWESITIPSGLERSFFWLIDDSRSHWRRHENIPRIFDFGPYTVPPVPEQQSSIPRLLRSLDASGSEFCLESPRMSGLYTDEWWGKKKSSSFGCKNIITSHKTQVVKWKACATFLIVICYLSNRLLLVLNQNTVLFFTNSHLKCLTFHYLASVFWNKMKKSNTCASMYAWAYTIASVIPWTNLTSINENVGLTTCDVGVPMFQWPMAHGPWHYYCIIFSPKTLCAAFAHGRWERQILISTVMYDE